MAYRQAVSDPPDGSDEDLDFGSGAVADAGDESESDRTTEPPTVDAPTLVEGPTDPPDVLAEPPASDDPVGAVSDFLDDFVDSDEFGDSVSDDGTEEAPGPDG